MRMDECNHGGALDLMRARFPQAPEPWIDLSTGINPWPYPLDSSQPETLQRLPTVTATVTCRNAMAETFGAPAECVLPIPGSELLIRLLPTLLRPRRGTRVAITRPTFADHAKVWRAAGCRVIETPDPLDALASTDLVVLCNPNNPDGRVWIPDRLEAARAVLAERGGWLIVDEAYADVRPDLSMAMRGGRTGLIILRSFGKFFGLPGLRLGSLIAPQDTLETVRQYLGIWSVSGPALAAGAQAYRDRGWQQDTRHRLATARARLDAVLNATDLRVVDGVELFRFVEVDDAGSVWHHLAKCGISVRRFNWSRNRLRIGLPPDADADARLAQALLAR